MKILILIHNVFLCLVNVFLACLNGFTLYPLYCEGNNTFYFNATIVVMNLLCAIWVSDEFFKKGK